MSSSNKYVPSFLKRITSTSESNQAKKPRNQTDITTLQLASKKANTSLPPQKCQRKEPSSSVAILAKSPPELTNYAGHISISSSVASSASCSDCSTVDLTDWLSREYDVKESPSKTKVPDVVDLTGDEVDEEDLLPGPTYESIKSMTLVV